MPDPLAWGIANGMWFAKTRSGRYRIREAPEGFIVSHSPSGRVWYALRDEACASLEEAKACAQEHAEHTR